MAKRNCRSQAIKHERKPSIGQRRDGLIDTGVLLWYDIMGETLIQLEDRHDEALELL